MWNKDKIITIDAETLESLGGYEGFTAGMNSGVGFTLEQVKRAAKIFDNHFFSITAHSQWKDETYERFYVGGKSVQELCAGTKNDNVENRKAYLIAAVVERKQDVDLVYDKTFIGGGNQRVVSLACDVTEKEPPLTRFQSFLHKLGLYKTPAEKRQAEYLKREKEANPQAEEKRKKALLERHNNGPEVKTAVKEREQKKQDVPKAEASPKRKAQKKQEQPAPKRLEYEQKVGFAKQNEEESKALWRGMDIVEGEHAHFKAHGHPEHLVMAQLMIWGHSLGDIMDQGKELKSDDKYQKREAESAVRGMLDRNNPMETAEFCREAAFKLSRLPALQIDRGDPEQLAANRREIYGRATVAAALSREFDKDFTCVIGDWRHGIQDDDFGKGYTKSDFRRYYRDLIYEADVEGVGRTQVADYRKICEEACKNPASMSISGPVDYRELCGTLKTAAATYGSLLDSMTPAPAERVATELTELEPESERARGTRERVAVAPEKQLGMNK